MDDRPLLTRIHPTIRARMDQLSSNTLALRGGRPYIDHRLTRFPYEPEGSWSGNKETGAKGRKDRAYLVNYSARIASKINQYVFAQKIEREGAAPEFIADVTRTRMSISDFMTAASTTITSSSWGWISVDRLAPSVDTQTGTIRSQTIAEREIRGDRVFWRLWQPQEVVDWYFGADGSLEWLITEERIYNAANPHIAGAHQRVRTFWEKGQGVRFFFDINDEAKVESERAFTLSAPIVPFIPVGTISPLPWWFDDVEMIQASILNLENAHGENLYQTVYPQMVLPASLKNDAGGGDGSPSTGSLTRLVGLKYPIFESEIEKDITRYVVPPGDGLKLLPDELQRRKLELFDVVGMAMNNPESKQVASAESKRWDNLDPSAVLAQRATILEEAELRAVDLSAKIDSTFKVYKPSYVKVFDISDVKADFTALLELQAVDLPPSGRRELLYAAVKLMDKLTLIPPDRRKVIDAEIAELDLDASPMPAPPVVQPPPPAG